MKSISPYRIIGTFVIFISAFFSQETIPAIGARLKPVGQMNPKASFLGIRNNERVGYSLSPAGDVDADGYDDFLIGTFHNSKRGHDAGAVYLILGQRNAHWGWHFSLAGADACFLGRHAYDAVGSCVAGPGDLNGDGYDDIIIGAPAGNEEEVPDNPGHVFIVFGKRSPDWGFDFILEKHAEVNLYGELATVDTNLQAGLAGFDIAVIGDLNGDGCDEILISAPYFDGYKTDGGKVYLVPGRSGHWPELAALAEISVATFRCTSGREPQFGFSLTGLGDVNGDAIPDFAIGAPNISKIYLFYGNRDMNWGFDFDARDADITFVGARNLEKAGKQVAGVGDTNGDGINDIAISATKNRDTGNDAGKVYLVLGRPGGWEDTIYLSDADASFCGEAEDDFAGWSLSGIGDYDGDNLDDFVIGMFNDPDRSKPGKAWFIGGRRTGWPVNKNLADVSNFFLGEENGDLTGFGVSSAGDVDADGFDDFIVAAPYSSYYRTWGGQIYLFTKQRKDFTVSGRVTNYYDQTDFEHVTLAFTAETIQNFVTEGSGEFEFEGWELADYQLTAALESNPDTNRSVVNAYDAAIAARFVLGLDSLEAESQFAADVDRDGEVTLLDASQILQYSLEIPLEAESQVGRWIFFPAERNYPALAGDFENQDFSGLICGNVDGEWPLSGFQNANALILKKHSVTELQLRDDRALRLPVCFDASTDVLAFNLFVNYDTRALKFKEIIFADHLNDFQIIINDDKTDELKVAGFGIQPLQRKGLAGEIVFQVNKLSALKSTEIHSKLQLNNEHPGEQVTKVLFGAKSGLPVKFELSQNYPNPFNSSTVIKYALPVECDVTLRIYNMLGQTVLRHQLAGKSAGNFQFQWNGKDSAGNHVPSGVYFYEIIAGDFHEIKKCILLF